MNNLRKLDAVGKWQENAFLILLPETSGTYAVKVVQKIRRIVKTKNLIYNGITYEISVRLRSVEYVSSLEESLDRINNR